MDEWIIVMFFKFIFKDKWKKFKDTPPQLTKDKADKTGLAPNNKTK